MCCWVRLTGQEKYHQDAQRWLNYWTVGFDNERIHYTRGGLAWLDKWGLPAHTPPTPLSLAFVYSDSLEDPGLKKRYHDFGVRQIDYILGNNPAGRELPGRVRHPNLPYPVSPSISTRFLGEHCQHSGGEPSRGLWSGKVGGPGPNDEFEDSRIDWIRTESAIDYTPGFAGALARLVQEFGGEALDNFSAAGGTRSGIPGRGVRPRAG